MDLDLDMVFAFVIGSVSVARMTRLVVDDDMPMFMWFREWWITHTNDAWGILVTCPFCVSVWLAAADTAWAFGSDLHWTWWFFNLFLAGAYLAAMINVRDIPPED